MELNRTFRMLLPWLLIAAGIVLICIALPWKTALALFGLALVVFGILHLV